MTLQFDGIIIGSGQAGNPLAKELAKNGWKMALIEEKEIGGCCINRGCTPTKTLVASAKEMYLAQKSKQYGVEIPQITIDFPKVIERKNKIVQSFRESSYQALLEAGVIIYFGKAEFMAPHRLIIHSQQEEIHLESNHIFINTGGRTALPELEGLPEIPYLTSTSIMELDQVPPHLVILGGGYIGLEFAQMFKRFGSTVTIIHHGKQLLKKEDLDVSEEVRKILVDEGITIYLESSPQKISKTNTGFKLDFNQGLEQLSVEGSHLLVATGRSPNIEGLNLEKAGITVNHHKEINVNPYLETNVEGIYALGDVKGGPAFTHIAYDDYRILRDRLLYHQDVSTEGRMVPYTVFIDPQLGRIGLTEEQARQKYPNVLVGKIPMTYVARAIECGETKGFMKVIVDQKTNQILGASVLGMEGGEIASLIQIAMMGKLPYQALKEGIFSHPTLAESLNTVFSHLV